jgi:hypothetical protein
VDGKRWYARQGESTAHAMSLAVGGGDSYLVSTVFVRSTELSKLIVKRGSATLPEAIL